MRVGNPHEQYALAIDSYRGLQHPVTRKALMPEAETYNATSPVTPCARIARFASMAAFVALLSVARCDHSTSVHIHFIVPTGYRGVFVITRDEHSSTRPSTSGEKIVYTIPPSGVLSIADDAPLRAWHTELAAFA